jgi:hypothetical protein
VRAISTVVVALALAACETTEVRDLRSILADTERELADRRLVADKLNEERRNRPVCGDLPAPTKGLEGRGTGVGAFTTIRERAHLALLTSFDIDEAGHYWRATFETPSAPPSPEPKKAATDHVAASKERALPDPSVFSGKNGERLRLEVARTQKEVADFDRIISEVEAYEAENRSYREKLKLLDALEQRRLASAEAFFGGDKPLLSSGHIEIADTSLTISGKLGPGHTKDELRAAVPQGEEIIRLEESGGIVSLEVKRGGR